MILRKHNFYSVSEREILRLTGPFQLIKYRSHLLSGGLICRAQSSRGIQLDVGGCTKIRFQTVEGDFRISLVSKAKSILRRLFIHSG